MAYSYIQYTGNGSSQNFTFPFPYIQQADIIPVIDGVTAVPYDPAKYLGVFATAPTLDNSGNALASGALYFNAVSSTMQIYTVSTWIPANTIYVYSFLTASTVQVVPAPPVGAAVYIHRKTSIAAPIVNFTDGSVLQSSDLDLLATFSLYTAQENADVESTTTAAAITAASAASAAIVTAAASSTSASNSLTSANTSAAQATISTNQATLATNQASNAATSASLATAEVVIATAKALLTAADVVTTAANSASASNSATYATATIDSSVKAIGQDLSLTGITSTADYGSILDPVITSGSGVSKIATVSANITSVNTTATNIAAIIDAPTQATNAATSATSAATSATNAATSATASAGSATTATTAASSLTAALASFRAKYLGAFSTDPTLDGNGLALTTGAEYFNSVSTKLRIYNGSAWEDYDADAQIEVTNAALSAASAAGYAATATTQATNASSSASTASTQAGIATTQASAASGSATGAASSASNASTSATAASASATAAALSALTSVTSVTASSPVVSTGGLTPVISIPVATTSVSGYLSSTDWASFNGKQVALGFTPYNATNPNSYISQASISALPISQLATTLDFGMVP